MTLEKRKQQTRHRQERTKTQKRAPPEDVRDLPIDERQFPTFNDPAYDVPIPAPTVTVPLIEAEVPVPDTGMLVTTATTAAVAAAGAVAATQAVKPLADFLIKQFKTGFKILFNKLLKKKVPNYLDETKVSAGADRTTCPTPFRKRPSSPRAITSRHRSA